MREAFHWRKKKLSRNPKKMKCAATLQSVKEIGRLWRLYFFFFSHFPSNRRRRNAACRDAVRYGLRADFSGLKEASLAETIGREKEATGTDVSPSRLVLFFFIACLSLSGCCCCAYCGERTCATSIGRGMLSSK